MSDNTDLESRMVAAIRHYRAALELAEHLERKDASAQRAVTSTLLDLERAVRDKAAPHLKHSCVRLPPQQFRGRTIRGPPWSRRVRDWIPPV